jgi:hypothetical protein
MRSIRTFNASPMTIQELQLAVPSAFARQPHDSRTRKYGFVPTFEIIEGLGGESRRTCRAFFICAETRPVTSPSCP